MGNGLKKKTDIARWGGWSTQRGGRCGFPVPVPTSAGAGGVGLEVGEGADSKLDFLRSLIPAEQLPLLDTHAPHLFLPALSEAEAGGSQVRAQPGHVTDITRPCLKMKRKKDPGCSSV